MPPGVWPSRTPPGWLSSRVGRPGAASPTTLPNAAVDARASAVSGLAGGRGGLPKRPHCACGRIVCWYERVCCQKRRRWPLEQPAIANRRLPGQGGGSYIENMMNTGHKKLATLGFLRCSSPNGSAPNIEALKARSHLPRSRGDRTTPLNNSPHSSVRVGSPRV